MRKLLLVAAVALVFFVTGSAKQNGVTKLPESWKQLDAGYFTVYAPATWAFRKMQGIDSDVGAFVGDGTLLEFDYGHYSNPLSGEKEPTYVVSEEKVGGRPARIVSPRIPGHGVTGIYFPDVGETNALNISARDLSESQQKTALTIFRTIRFRPTLPRR